jgi:C4-dicarboxylate-specific signal transduction histidine kinase
LGILNGQPIRRQVVVATGVLLLPFAIAAMWASEQTRLERADEVRAQATAIASTAKAYLNQYLSGVDSLASVLERYPDVVALNRAGCDRLFAGILHDQPLILNIGLTDTHGTLKGSGLAVPPQLVQPPRSYIADVVRTGRPVVSELVKGQLSGKPTIVLAYPVRGQDGAVNGVLGLGLDLTRLQTVFGSIPLPPGSVITLSDSASRVLARSRDAERYIGTIVTRQPEAPRDVAPSQTLVGLDGIERFYGNASVDRGPWVLSVGIPSSVAASSVANLRRRNLTIGLIAIVSVLVVSLWSSAILSRDLNLLRAGVQRIADGDLSPPVQNPTPNLELQQLQSGFITMAANLREAHAALDHQIEQERKMRETLQSLQRQVVRQERLAAVGVLVSGVAHELNNPLQAILGTAELLERQEDLSPQAREELAFVKTQSGRAREIIRNLSRFSSQQSEPPAFIDLRDVIAEVIQLRRRDLDNLSIALDVEISSARAVYANFTEIEQVALNFVINAQQSIEAAGRPKGRILIRLEDAGKRVMLEVLDNGPGVSASDEPKLFQPFFTTKPVGKGTGLGLSVSYGIIDSYGGSIGYRTNQWGGATFFFELPAFDTPAEAPPVTTASAEPGTDDGQALLHRRISPRI